MSDPDIFRKKEAGRGIRQDYYDFISNNT